ncbi:DUF222 domain-containing protein [Pseudonocardia kunmingensis]|uniref:DUF222 domain-containing protein n=1 Tax=Pseudonocardia kunmingensis TaxID=630975 RepID=UPI001153BE8F|nr:DUF222 domain-containing protein [Pseudonocardia kunmingensis]
MAGVAELVDQAVSTPPGPQLSALLNRLPWRTIPNSRLVEVVQARSRQRAHEEAEWLAGVVEVAHTVALAELGADRAESVARAGEAFEWASHEIAAALTWTPTAADRELGFALGLVERLPLVYAALHRGEIDRGKARVFVEYLDPAHGEVGEEQSRRLCERFLPAAPGLTTRQLGDRIYRALHAIDPHYRRRRYRRAVQERGVALYLDPATGTATLVGTGSTRGRGGRRGRAPGPPGPGRQTGRAPRDAPADQRGPVPGDAQRRLPRTDRERDHPAAAEHLPPRRPPRRRHPRRRRGRHRHRRQRHVRRFHHDRC